MGVGLAAQLEAGVSSPFEMADLVGDAGSLDMVVAALEPLFSQDELGMYLIELCVELTLGVIEVSVSLDLGNIPPVVELHDC